VIVEPDLAHRPGERPVGDGRLRPPRRLLGVGGKRPRGVRVHADREPHLGPGRADDAGLRQLRLVVCRQDHERLPDPGLAGPADHRVEILGELGSRQVAMRIHEHDLLLPGG
jgi:hypothetical protein